MFGDALVEHLRDILAPPDAPADLGRGKILQRGVFQHRDAAGEPVHPFAAAGIDVYRVFEDAVVLFPAVEPFYLVGAHEDRELHIRAVVLGQVAQRVDRIRRLGQQEFDDRGFYPVGIARRRAGRLGHFEPIHLGGQLFGLFIGALGRNDEHQLVAQSFSTAYSARAMCPLWMGLNDPK